MTRRVFYPCLVDDEVESLVTYVWVFYRRVLLRWVNVSKNLPVLPAKMSLHNKPVDLSKLQLRTNRML